MLTAAHAEAPEFFNPHAPLADYMAFEVPGAAAPGRLGGLCKDPSADPSRCCAISPATPTASPSPIVGCSADDAGVTFNCKDYRIEGPDRYKTMTLTAHEFIRRFLMHVLPKGFHRIRHYGLLPMAPAPTTSRVLASCWCHAARH